MAKLRMTNADYLAIAVSPALVMALVGSLVFFLIEVLYVGAYSARLNYVFALFVFATVLITRIAIELGSEVAAMYSIPLGLLTYVALQRFVEHPGPLSWLVNLLLLAVVWWCAHKLTWDSTVVDDNEDSSGEGLLGRVGVDNAEDCGADAPARADNELLADSAADMPWWQRMFRTRQGPHTPGVWVLYFSLAALPLFGIGQHWVPAGDAARRRYVFGLLAVYVAAALALLVTTSFLGLRRYLRQRRVEMPAPMAVTWVSLGAALIVLVMFAAALLPRPKAEYALARPPWQAGSPGDVSANRVSVGNEGTVDESAENHVTSDNQPDAPLGDEVGPDGQTPMTSDQGEKSTSTAEQPPSLQRQQGAESSTVAGEPASDPSQPPSEPGGSSPRSDANQPAQSSDDSQQQSPGSQQRQGERDDLKEQGPESPGGDDSDSDERGSAMRQMLEHADESFQPPPILQTVTSSLANLLKLVLYALLAVVILYLAWRYRAEIARALGEMIQQLREFWASLFGRRDVELTGEDGSTTTVGPRRRTFAEFTDPFLTGRYQQLPPTELVRYTFEAFEAWASDRGRPRSPDQTPQELLRGAVPPRSPMYEPASRLVRLYSEAAYASKPVPRESAAQLRDLWHMMHLPPQA